MKEIVIFEWKKLWQSKLTVLAVVLLIVTCIFLNFATFFMFEAESLGRNSTIRKETKGGTLNQEYIDHLIESLDLYELDPIEWNEFLQNSSYSSALQFIGFVKDLSEEELQDILANEENLYQQYKMAVSQQIEHANLFNWFQYTAEQMARIDNKIDQIQTPFDIGYNRGIGMFIYQYQTLYILVLLVISFLLSSIFTCDSPQGIDELTLALKKGRKQNFNARIITGNILALTIYAIFIGVMLLQHALVFSLQGWGDSLQSFWVTAIYNISIGSGILIIILHGLFTVLLVANLVMLISITIKKSKLATLLSVATMGLLVQLTNTSNPLLLQLNPVYFATQRFNSNWGFEFYYFIGNIMIPYTVIVLMLGSLYFLVIRLLTVKQYKRYTLQ